jgi:hypothetical protein
MLPKDNAKTDKALKKRSIDLKELASNKKSKPTFGTVVSLASKLNQKQGNLLEAKDSMGDIKSSIGQMIPSGLILPKVQPLKIANIDHPYTLIGKGLQGFHFIKEIQKGKFVNKKIERIGETVISGLSNFLTGIEKKRNTTAAKRIVKKQLSSAEIMNFMTLTYLEE